MNDNLSEIVCIVDRSGSMHSIVDDAIGGFNAFLQEQKIVPGEATLTLALFNHDYKLVHNNVPIQDAPELDTETYRPGGMTALLDAVGRTIDAVGQRLASTPEAERPVKVIVAILTDGLENSSKEYSLAKVAQMIEHQREVYSWEFIFLAANQDAIQTAGAMSIQAEDAINFDATGKGVLDANLRMSSEIAFRRARR